jgi:hypothetical protein
MHDVGEVAAHALEDADQDVPWVAKSACQDMWGNLSQVSTCTIIQK